MHTSQDRNQPNAPLTPCCHAQTLAIHGQLYCASCRRLVSSTGDR